MKYLRVNNDAHIVLFRLHYTSLPSNFPRALFYNSSHRGDFDELMDLPPNYFFRERVEVKVSGVFVRGHSSSVQAKVLENLYGRNDVTLTHSIKASKRMNSVHSEQS